MPNESKKRARW
jgi:hypothetical protein